MDNSSSIYKVRHCSKCLENATVVCRFCPRDICYQCEEDHVCDHKTKDHTEEIIHQQEKKSCIGILNVALLKRISLLTRIKSDFRECHMYYRNPQSELFRTTQKLKKNIDNEVKGFNMKHRCLRQRIEIKRQLFNEQIFEEIYEQSPNNPIRFLCIKRNACNLLVRHRSAQHSSLFMTQESLNKCTVINCLSAFQNIKSQRRKAVKILSDPLLKNSITGVKGIRCSHISHVTSDLLWVSDDKNNLTQINKRGENLYHINDLYSGVLSSSHTVNNDSELIYINSNFKIQKLSKNFKTKTSVKIDINDWTPICVYWSRATEDLLVGMKLFKSGKVVRYSQTGKLTQTIRHTNTGRELYSLPYFITENRNGDILVSCSLHALVATDRNGEFLFSYRGNNPKSRIWAHGLCTDVHLHIFVCDLMNNSVHVIDKDGQFLSFLFIRPLGILQPCSLSYDITTHCIWVGSYHNNSISVYTYLSMEDAFDDQTPTDVNAILIPSEIKVKRKEEQVKNMFLGKALLSPVKCADVDRCGHISFLTLDRIWISDHSKIVIMQNELFHTDKKVIQDSFIVRHKRFFNGFHTMCRDGTFIYIDKTYTIKKVSIDLKKETSFIASEDTVWIPLCVYSSLSSADLLVGVWRKTPMAGKILRYNQSGTLVKTIQHDCKGLQLYRAPIYVTENNNGDIVVSDYDLSIFMSGALVVNDSNGLYRFQYTGNPPESGLEPYGICTDASSRIMVCDGRTNKVHLIDSDGQFLAYFEISEDIVSPCSLSYNINTKYLCVGSRESNKVCIYRFLTGQTTTGYSFVANRNARENKENTGKALEITRLAQQVPSFETLKLELMRLAERPTPERFNEINRVAETTKLILLEKLTGISYDEYQNCSYLRRVFTREGRKCLYVIQQIDKIKIAALKYAFWKLSNLPREGTRV